MSDEELLSKAISKTPFEEFRETLFALTNQGLDDLEGKDFAWLLSDFDQAFERFKRGQKDDRLELLSEIEQARNRIENERKTFAELHELVESCIWSESYPIPYEKGLIMARNFLDQTIEKLRKREEEEKK